MTAREAVNKIRSIVARSDREDPDEKLRLVRVALDEVDR